MRSVYHSHHSNSPQFDVSRCEKGANSYRQLPQDSQRGHVLGQEHPRIWRQNIHEYTKHINKNLRSTNYRLCDLFHDGGYIDRPPQQLRTETPGNKFLVHRLSKKGREVLGSRIVEHTPKGSSSWEHDFLRSCYTATMELACREKPEEFGFIPHHKVIENAMKKTGKYPVFQVDGEVFNPDALFGIHYKKTNAFRLFAVEIDMMTESLTSKSGRTKTIQKSLEQYREFIKKGMYKSLFPKVDGFMLITITINYTHAENMVKIAPKEPFFLFNWVPGFEYYVTPPPLMPHLFYEGYARSGHSEFNISNP